MEGRPAQRPRASGPSGWNQLAHPSTNRENNVGYNPAQTDLTGTKGGGSWHQLPDHLKTNSGRFYGRNPGGGTKAQATSTHNGRTRLGCSQSGNRAGEGLLRCTAQRQPDRAASCGALAVAWSLWVCRNSVLNTAGQGSKAGRRGALFTPLQATRNRRFEPRVGEGGAAVCEFHNSLPL